MNNRKYEKEYQIYRLNWMLEHGFSINDLIGEMQAHLENRDENIDIVNIKQLFAEWEQDSGFSGQIWACYDEFVDNELNEGESQKADFEFLEYKGVVFDDFNLEDGNLQNGWACICKECAEKHGFQSEVSDGCPSESPCSVWGCQNEADHYIDFEGTGEIKRQSEILKQERFFVRDGYIEEIRYNPYCASGGQFVHIHILHDVVDRAATESIEGDALFDFIERASQQFLSDVGSNTYDDSLRKFNQKPFLVRCQVDTHTEGESAMDDFRTGEKVRTPRGTFTFVNMAPEQMELIGYGFHHFSDDRKYAIMGNGTDAFAVLNV